MKDKIKIWAHRGCSQMYPENTLLSFRKACEIKGLTGIELDIQLTKDKKIVVIHDERVDRTTNGTGLVCGYTLSELKQLKIKYENNDFEFIPTIEEVFELLKDKFKYGFKLNIELKNSNIRYNGMEEQIIKQVNDLGIKENVVYSSFYAKSLELIKAIDSEANIGILDIKASDCLYKLKGGCGAVALHPYWKGIDLPTEILRDYDIRAWFSGHLYPEKPTGAILNLKQFEKTGITDVFLNEPEKYL